MNPDRAPDLAEPETEPNSLAGDGSDSLRGRTEAALRRRLSLVMPIGAACVAAGLLPVLQRSLHPWGMRLIDWLTVATGILFLIEGIWARFQPARIFFLVDAFGLALLGALVVIRVHQYGAHTGWLAVARMQWALAASGVVQFWRFRVRSPQPAA